MQAFRHITATEGIGGLYRCSRSPSSLLFCPLCGEKGPARINSDKGARACGAEAKKRFAASAQVQHDCAVVCMGVTAVVLGAIPGHAVHFAAYE
eukprot:307365-Rhodomonas_salina.1